MKIILLILCTVFTFKAFTDEALLAFTGEDALVLTEENTFPGAYTGNCRREIHASIIQESIGHALDLCYGVYNNCFIYRAGILDISKKQCMSRAIAVGLGSKKTPAEIADEEVISAE